MSIWDWLLNPAGLTAHGFCLSWAPGLIALHAGSDALIGLAYLSIPVALGVLLHRRPDIRYSWVAGLFIAFILACGATHLFSILTLWVPAYGIEGLVKLLTAVLSIATAAVLWPLIPKVAALPSMAQLEILNGQLSATIDAQRLTANRLQASEAEVRRANLELERRVAERTAALTEVLAQRTNEQLAMARNEAQFRASFEEAAVGKTQADPVNGRLLRVNRAFARMLGYEPDELVGRLGWELTAPEDIEGDQAEYERLLAGELDTYVREKRYLRKSGESLWCRASAVIVRAPDTGEPFLSVSVIEDIDESHKARLALQAVARDLELMVAERTAALAQRDLLLREVYHRVKNNLQIVNSLLLMQARQVADPAAKASLLALRGRVYTLGLVHHQLMKSSNLSTFDMAQFLEELSSNLIEGAADRDIALTVRAMPLEVGLDFAIPLGLVVTELVTNSLKHAFPGGKGGINVELDRGDDGHVVLVVSDDGVGAASKAGPAAARATLGMRIITGLVAQLKGTFAMDHEHGTRSEIRVPQWAAP